MLEREWNYYSAVLVTGKNFMEKLVCPYKEAAPTLPKPMLPVVREVPSSFRFTRPIMGYVNL